MQSFGLALGVLTLVVSTFALADAAYRLASRWWPDDLLVRLVASAVLTTSAIVVLLEALGTIGQLGPAVVLGTAVALWGSAVYLTRRPGILTASSSTHPRAFITSAQSLLFLVPAGGLVFLLAAYATFGVLYPRPLFDVIAGHLPVVVEWLQHGDLRFMPYVSPVSPEPHYPASSQLLGLWLLIPTHRDTLVQLASLPGVAMLVFGVALLARELGAGKMASATLALLIPTLPLSLGQLVGTNMTDMVATGAFASSAALIGFYRHDQRLPVLAVAGLAAGLAAGTRYAALTALVPVLIVLTGLIVRQRNGAPARVAVFAIGATLTGAYFYVRNAVLTGDPVWPQSIPGHPVEATEKIAFPLFKSYLDVGWAPSDWPIALKQALVLGGPIFILLSLGVIIPAVFVALRRRSSWTAIWVAVALAEFIGFLALPLSAGFVVNGHLDRVGVSLNLRYLLPTMVVTAALLAAEVDRLPRLGREATAGALMVLAAVAAVLATESPLPILAVVCVAAAVLLIGVAWWILPRAVFAPVALVTSALTLALGSPRMASFHDAGRTATMPFEWAALQLRPDDQSVAVAGFCEIYALYGHGLDRRVEYLTGNDGVVNRPLAATFEGWRQSLKDHHVKAVVLGSDVCFLNVDVPQRRWVEDDSTEFHLRYSDGKTMIYDVSLS